MDKRSSFIGQSTFQRSLYLIIRLFVLNLKKKQANAHFIYVIRVADVTVTLL